MFSGAPGVSCSFVVSFQGDGIRVEMIVNMLSVVGVVIKVII